MMHGLRHLLPRLRRHPWLLLGGVLFALVSAGGLGAGLASLGPVLRIILQGGDGASARELLAEYNQSLDWMRIPDGLIDLVPTDPFHAVVMIMVGLAALTLIGALANFLHQFLALEITSRTVAEIRDEVFAHVMVMPLADVQARGAAELVSRINKDSMALQGGILALTSKVVAQVTKGLVAFVVAVWFDWRLTVVALVVTPVLGAVLRAIGRRIRRATRAALEAQEDLLRVSNESIQGVRAVKSSGAEAAARGRFGEANGRVLHEELRVRTARALAGPVVELLAVLVLIGLVIIASWQILDEKSGLEFDTFLLTLGALGVAGGSLRPLAGLLTEIQAASAPAERLDELLAIPDEFAPTEGAPGLAEPTRSLRFREVKFRYPGTEEDVLKGIDLEIRQGEQVAIVGPNGCGKTTLLSLVPRLHDPTAGTVEIDGVDVRGVDLASLRRRIGVVTQETVLFRGSIRENIAFGLEVSDDRIRAAADLAHASAFIDAMPAGLDTEVAELGSSLSGGQRQRLAIARALLRDPAILIMDEATSQVDAESEDQINAAINDFSEGRTVLVIAHRLSTVLVADRIVVIDQGVVVGEGSHDDLLERCEVYARLARTQLAPG